MNIHGLRTVRFYTITGILAIIVGGVLSAFLAKQPSTVAMWTSAYLVLVVGVTQIFLGEVLAKLGCRDNGRLAYMVFGLFNAGNALVITSTAVKYAGLGWNIPLTAAGSALLVAALTLLVWHIRGAKSSRLKTAAYIVITGLILSIPIGLVLAHN